MTSFFLVKCPAIRSKYINVPNTVTGSLALNTLLPLKPDQKFLLDQIRRDFLIKKLINDEFP